MFCGYPPHRRPACIALRPIPWPQCFGGRAHHDAPAHHYKQPRQLVPITGSSDCPSALSPFSPISPLSAPGEVMSPITPYNGNRNGNGVREVMSPITPYNGDENSNGRSKVFVGIMPGCGACKQLLARLREDGISPRTLDTTTREGKQRFAQIMGFDWMYQTYPQMFVETPRGWYHIGGNSDYANMREALRDCRLSSDPDVECLIRSGAQAASP